jgi:hypothetical protein
MPANGAINRSRDIVALGARSTGTFGGFAYEAEAIVQLGASNTQDHLAFAGLGEASYKLEDLASLQFSLGGSIGTGDGMAGDGESHEVDPFFPTTHMPYGVADWIELRNGADVYLEVAVAPQPVTVSLAGHLMFNSVPLGRWAAREMSANATMDGSAFLGVEIDALVGWKPDPMLVLGAGYALFLPAAGAERYATPEPADHPTHWAYLEIDFKVPP